MPSIEEGLYDLGRLDRLAYGETGVHRLDPRAKVLTTLVFLVTVVSFGRYELVAMIPFLLYPIALGAQADLPFGFLARKLAAVAPFAILVGVFNPFLDRQVVGHLGGVAITAGWVSYASILLRFALTASAALVLIATTSFSGVCAALRRLGMPDVLVNQLLFLYRYIFVLGEETMRVARARALRSFGGRGTGIGAHAQILGHLLLRTYGRATRIYRAMLGRAFDGQIRILRELRFSTRDVVFTAGWTSAFILFRVYNIPVMLGRFMTGLIS